jgi:hypothetical protein
MQPATTTTFADRARFAVKTKPLLVCGAIAGPLFVVTLLIEGATRPQYNPVRHPGSSRTVRCAMATRGPSGSTRTRRW